VFAGDFHCVALALRTFVTLTLRLSETGIVLNQNARSTFRAFAWK